MNRMHRRAFIKAVGAGLVAAPFLAPGRGWAASEIPKRLICIMHPNGPVPQQFWPNGGPGNFGAITSMNRATASLSPFMKKLLFVGEIDGRTHLGQAPFNVNSHTAAWVAAFTGTYPTNEGGGEATGLANGPSIDHVIAQAIYSTARTPRPALHLWTAGKKDKSVANSRISYSGASAANAPFLSPYAAFDSIFQNVSAMQAAAASTPATATTNTAVDFAKRRKCKGLDRTLLELNSLKRRLGAEDATRLEQHASSIAELQKQLLCSATAPSPTTGAPVDQPTYTPVSCAKPSLAQGLDPTDPKHYAAISKMHIDIMVTAMACDITRVGTLQYSAASGTGDLPIGIDGSGKVIIGTGSGHHDLSHVFSANTGGGNGENGEPAPFAAISTWYCEQLAYLLAKLEATPEPFGGPGTMLDNTLVFFAGDLGGGSKHVHNNRPYIFAGMGDKFNTGHYINSNKGSPGQVLVSVANAFGVNVNSFGNSGPGHTGKLAGILK